MVPMFQKPKKKKKQRNAVLDWLGYAAMRVALFIMWLFPVQWNLKTGCLLGSLMWRYYHRGRQRALENLRASFPDKDPAWIERVGRRSFQQIAMLAIDIFFTPRIVRKDNWREYCAPRNIERIKWLMQERRGLILLTAQYGNFEIIGYMMGLFGFNIYSVARPLDNPYINRYLYGIRQRKGQKILDKKGATEQIEQIFSEGATLGFIADQDAGRKGVFVDFFGRKASTYKSIGLLAIHYNLPIGIGCSRRVGDRFFFELECTRLIMPEEWADKPEPLGWITQQYTKAIEDFIRQDPTQYWWLHRRWKTRPKEERQSQLQSAP